MNFTLSTKPFSDALNLGVVSNNISKYFLKSCLVQMTANRNALRINIEAANIASEILLKGSGDSDQEVTVFVDAALIKQLASTFESSTTTIEFTEGGIILHSGTSKFTLPKMAESGDMTLRRPQLPELNSAKVELDSSDWKFIDDYQMFARAMSFVHPIYTKVYIGQEGDVIIGDFDNSLFTLSKKSKLGKSCILSDTIVNLLVSLPEGATITSLDANYRVDVKTDGFEYAAEFTPQFETDEGVGEYNAQVFIDMVNKDPANTFKVSVPVLNKYLSQATLLSKSTDDTMKASLAAGQLQLLDSNVDCKVAVEGDCPEFQTEFKTDLLKSVLTNVDSESVNITLLKQDEEVAGWLLWTNDLTIILGSME